MTLSNVIELKAPSRALKKEKGDRNVTRTTRKQMERDQRSPPRRPYKVLARSTMGVILENTRKHLAENATAGSTSSGNIATLNRVILPVIDVLCQPLLLTN